MNRTLLLSVSLAFVAACGGSKSEPAPSCSAGLTLCGSVCVDLKLDSAHCGTCDTACAGDRACAAGVCEISCGADHLVCGDVCVAYLTDSNNCGSCGNVCDSGYACEAGKCEIQCTAPATRCGSETAGFCADLASDEAHCGTCTTTCDTGKVCELGVCQITCPTGQIRCGSGATATCVDPSTDEGHCGNCTVACDAGETCRYGLCTSPSCSGLLLPGVPLSPSSGNPVGVGAADLTGDGITDLAIADDSPTVGGRLLRLDGRGDGTFAAPVVVDPFTYTSPSMLAVGDFDGDSKADVVVASGSSGVTTLQPLFGNGAGVFTAVTDSSLDAGAAPQAIVLADLNQDGRPDLVVGDGAAQATSNLRVFLNDGFGSFGISAGAGAPRTPNQILSVGIGVRAVAVGDVRANGDAAPDVVVVWDGTPPGGEVLLNDGGGTLSRPTFNTVPTHQFLLQTGTIPPVPLAPTALAVADLNGDGLADWAVAHAAGNAVTVVLAAWSTADKPQNGWAGVTWTLNAVAEPRALLVEDFDADSLPELVTVNAAAGALYYHHNAGPSFGGVQFDPPVSLPVGDRPVATAFAPVATAGFDYFFTANAGSGDVAATKSLGAGAFEAPIRLAASSGTSAIALGDFDEDASLDLALADVSSSYVHLWLGPLAAGGAPSSTITLAANDAPVSITSGTIDADAHADLALALEGTAQVALLWGSGTGGFTAPQYVGVGANPEQVVIVNLNGDALPDLVTADMGSDQLTVLLNQGARAFTASALPVGAGPRAVAALQLGAAACKSLVSANATAGTLTIHPCTSPGVFVAPIQVTACAGARSLATGDFDADGVADLVVACDAGIALFHVPGTGSLEGGALFDVGGAPRSVSAADVNADGWIDLIASVPASGGVTVLHGAAAMGFSPPSVYPVGGDPLETVTADLDGDSRTDVCAAVENPLGAFLGAGAAVLFSGCLP
jgi:hypothetical protein